MKQLLSLTLLLTLLISCSSSKILEPIPTKIKGVNLQNQTFNGIEYQCKIIFVDNKMPSMDNEPRKLYAIVELQPISGKFKDNWKIKTFQFDEETYTVFDDHSFLGKGLGVYKNAVREIAPNFKTSKT